jgi:hypothetical protein
VSQYPNAPANGAAVARVVRVVPEGAPRAVDPHVPLHPPRRAVDHEPRQQRGVGDGVAVVCLVRGGHDLEREVVGRPEVRRAREHVAVEGPAAVGLRRPAPDEEKLGHPAEDQLERVGPRGRVGRGVPRRDVPGDAGPDVHPELHAREQRVRRVVEALPRHAPVGDEDEVAVVTELRRHVPRRRRRRRGPHRGVLAVEDDEAAVGGEPEHARGVDERALAVGHPHHGGARDVGVPDAEVRPAIVGAGRYEEAQLEDAAGRDERLVAGDGRGLGDGVGGRGWTEKGGADDDKEKERARTSPHPRPGTSGYGLAAHTGRDTAARSVVPFRVRFQSVSGETVTALLSPCWSQSQP